MKKIALLLLVTACSSMTEGTYKKRFHLEDYKSAKSPEYIHGMLTEKMKKCYTQSDYPLYEKTVSVYTPAENSGTISYKIDNQSQGPKTLVMVEVLKDGEGSLVKVYSQGDIFRPAGVYKHQIQKWVDGLVVDCHGHGDV